MSTPAYGAKPTPPAHKWASPKGEAFGTDHSISADKAIGQKPLKAESSPLGEDVRRTEEVPTPSRPRIGNHPRSVTQGTVTPAAR